jgi:transposase
LGIIQLEEATMAKILTKRDVLLEARRLRAWELKQQGWKQTTIAKELGLSRGAVSQWFKRARTEGPDALRWHSQGGGPRPRLTDEQIRQLPTLLARAPQTYGLVGHTWTRNRIITLIQQIYGVRFSHGHIGRILTKSGVRLRRARRSGRVRHQAAGQAVANN